MATSIKIVIAGPGAGKTHNMITSIKAVLPTIYSNMNKICAVITYTNAAAEEIKERLVRIGNLPPNIFIGTFHSFLIRFLIEPFGHLVSDYPIDKNYIDDIELQASFKKWIIRKVDEKTYKTHKQRQAAISAFVRGVTNKKIKSISQKGVITYDKVLEIAFELIKNDRVIKIVSNRLSNIFVDEYQDTHSYQHAIIQKLLEQNNCAFYCVGDPLQSIFKFSYGSSKIVLKKEFRIDSLSDSPLLRLKDTYSDSVEEIVQNNRSTIQIANFLSKYTTKIGYLQTSINASNVPVHFINKTSIESACKSFYNLAASNNIVPEAGKMNFLHLATNWGFWDDVAGNLNIEIVDKGNHRKSTILKEVERCVLGSAGLTKTEVLQIIPKPSKTECILSFRNFCIKIYKLIRDKKLGAYPQKEIRNLFSITFNHVFNKDILKEIETIELTKSISDLNSARVIAETDFTERYYSSIHSAKGLEATCVLVFARNENELKTWLDYDNVIGKNDSTRLGFVAFSRARKLLCIACLENISQATKDKLEKLNVELVSATPKKQAHRQVAQAYAPPKLAKELDLPLHAWAFINKARNANNV